MKKNFFKKLSFVLALAMIVSVLAPAAGAFAASAPKLSASTKYLYLGVEDKNEYDFNIANKQKGWKYLWSSANEDVATVNEKNGLTLATGAGKTTVSVVITDADGEEVDELTANVIVRDNIKTLTITNTPADGKLAVGVPNDFNRSYVTVAGKKTGTSGITRWSVSPSVGATISDSGLFTATAAGEYTITARAFQSKTKYASWLTDATKYASYVTSNEATFKVTVAASIKAVKQVNLTKFSVEFDSDMSKSDLSATTAKLFQVINGTKVATGTEKIKEVKFDTTGKIATVEMYSNFVSKTTYEFVYGALTGTFTAAEKSLKQVASIQFADVSATLNQITDLKEKVTGLNKEGVVIYNAKDDADFAATISFSGDLTSNGYLDTTNKSVYIYTKGFTSTLTAKFSYYVYNDTTKVYDNLAFEDTAVVTGTEVDSNLNNSTLQYLITDAATAPTNDTTGWATSGFSIAAKDTGYYINVRYKNNNATSTTAYSLDTKNDTKFTFVSSDTDKLIINGDFFTPIAAGVVTILVKNNDTNATVVGTFDITIQAARGFASAVIDTPTVSVGNNATLGDNGRKATITVLDTMGAKAVASVTSVSLVTGPAGATLPSVTVAGMTPAGTDDFGKLFVNVDSRTSTAGAYQFKITVNHTATNTNKDVFFTVVVVEGNSGADLTVASWRLELSKTSLDLKKVNAAQTIAVGVYGYNTKGVKVDQLTNTEYDLTVKKGGTTIPAANFDDTNVYVVVAGVSPAAFTALEVNTYAVEAVLTATGATAVGGGRVTGSQIGFGSFSVIDTTTKTFVVEDPTVASGSVLTMVQNAFSLYLNGDKVSDANEANIVEITFNDGAGVDKVWNTSTPQTVLAGTNLSVKSVKYHVINNGTDGLANTADDTRTEYKFDLNVTIKAE